MLDPSLLAWYFVLVGLSLLVLAFVLYREARDSPELRFVAVVTGVLGVVSLAFTLLVWLERNRATQTTAQAPAPASADSGEESNRSKNDVVDEADQ